MRLQLRYNWSKIKLLYIIVRWLFWFSNCNNMGYKRHPITPLLNVFSGFSMCTLPKTECNVVYTKV